MSTLKWQEKPCQQKVLAPNKPLKDTDLFHPIPNVIWLRVGDGPVVHIYQSLPCTFIMKLSFAEMILFFFGQQCYWNLALACFE